MKKLFALLLILFPMSLFSQDVMAIIDKAEESYKGESSTGTFTMKVVTPDFERTVKMKSWWQGNDKALIEITYPSKEKGNKTLKIGNEMWSYMKSTETTIKIPPSMMLSSWNGSDLTNDDLVRETKLIDDYDIRLMFEEKIAGEMCWKIELKPKPETPVFWGKIYYWVRKTDYLPALIQYYDEKNVLYRTMKFSDIKKMGGRTIPTKWKIISNRKENNYTEFIYEDVKFDVKIKPRIFSLRELER